MKKTKPDTNDKQTEAAKELILQALAKHDQIDAAIRTTLELAREAGEALLKAKASCPHGRWTDLLYECFDGSVESARVYMRIAKHWDDARIKRSRERGIKIDTIASFLDVLRSKKDPIFVRNDDDEPVEDDWDDEDWDDWPEPIGHRRQFEPPGRPETFAYNEHQRFKCRLDIAIRGRRGPAFKQMLSLFLKAGDKLDAIEEEVLRDEALHVIDVALNDLRQRVNDRVGYDYYTDVQTEAETLHREVCDRLRDAAKRKKDKANPKSTTTTTLQTTPPVKDDPVIIPMQREPVCRDVAAAK